MLKNPDLESQGAPEVVVAFVADKMGSSEIPQMGAAFTNTRDQLVNLKTALNTARNSLTIPYLYTSQRKMSQSLIQSLQISSQGSVLSSNLATERCDAVLGKLEASPAVFSNGITDLILISFSDYTGQQVDECLQRVNTYVQEHVKQQYIALLTADAPHVDPKLTFSNDKLLENDIVSFSLLSQSANLPLTMRLFARAPSNNTNSTPFFVGPQFISPAILFGILLGFVLIFFLWQGIYQLTQIEAPVRFSHAKLQLSREY
jgi:hypothetical protein